MHEYPIISLPFFFLIWIYNMILKDMIISKLSIKKGDWWTTKYQFIERTDEIRNIYFVGYKNKSSIFFLLNIILYHRFLNFCCFFRFNHFFLEPSFDDTSMEFLYFTWKKNIFSIDFSNDFQGKSSQMTLHF